MEIQTRFLPSYQHSMITPEDSIKRALRAITNSGALMACIVDKEQRLLGIVTDSDIRRALLNGNALDDTVEGIMVTKPVIGSVYQDEEDLRELARITNAREIPLLDGNGRLQDIFMLLLHEYRHETVSLYQPPNMKPPLLNPLFLLAGGKGSRLRPVVSDRPKPLALVGGKPIMQTIIERSVQDGIRTFYVSLNFQAEKIISHLQESSYKDLDIRFVKEQNFLGTAGSLSFMNNVTLPFVVLNADILTTIPLDRVLDFHSKNKADFTCVVRSHRSTIPYGVIDIKGEQIQGIKEKPSFDYVVNSGIYVLSPNILTLVKENEHLDMPELILRAIKAGFQVKPFMLHEYWLDIGKPDDYAKANNEYHQIFGADIQ